MDSVMLNEPWTADIVGRMHRYRISNIQLAEKCEYNPAYLSTVLNGKKQFESDEAKERTKIRIMEALESLESEIDKRNGVTSDERSDDTV